MSFQKRSRRWTITIFAKGEKKLDYDGLIARIKPDSCRYFICGLEICPETNREHAQGFIHLTHGKSLSAVKKLLDTPHAHLEIAGGTDIENQTYCSKGTKICEVGTPSEGQGKRTDLIKAKESLEAGATMREIIYKCRSNQAIQFAQKWYSYCEPVRDWKCEVEWCYGLTGSGKSRYANTFKNAYWATKNSNWWDGYDAHEVVIIDDMRDDFCTFHDLLRLLDRYEYRLPIKGGFRQLLAKKIIITTTKHPKKFFSWLEDENINQLLRRITEIKVFSNQNVKITQK